MRVRAVLQSRLVYGPPRRDLDRIAAVTAPLLILETGKPMPVMRRYGDFPHWVRVAAGLPRDAAVVVDVQRGEPLPRREGFAGVIVTGSGAMVTDRAPWSEASAAWLADAARDALPVFGICFGHQLLAHGLGGEVGDNPAGRTMGTIEVARLPAAADDPLFATAPQRFAAQATHMQRVLRPPEGAVLLASAAHDPCHAFRWGHAAWGVQFHPEFSATHMRGYIRARAAVLREAGHDPAALVEAVSAAPHARRVLRRFAQWARRRSAA
jgi:GMP synthase (glutamine-hydrolysing)